MSTERATNRRLPFILRFTALLVIVLVVLIGGAMLVARATLTGVDCLRVSDGFQTRLLNVRTGAEFEVQTRSPNQTSYKSTVADASEASPDKTRIARLVGNQLHIDFHQPLLADIGIEPPISHVSWSPNGQWIAYYWQAHDGHIYMAVADQTGRQVQQQVLVSQPDEIVQFDQWSADSTYIAVSDQTSDFTHNIYTFYSIPDLKAIRLGDIAKNLLNSDCGSGSISISYCAHWSPQGHRVAFILANFSDFNAVFAGINKKLVILEPGTVEVHMFNLPANDTVRQTLLWSPDGLYIALAFADAGSEGQISLFGVDGTTIQNLDHVVESYNGLIYYSRAQMTWMPDSKRLLYFRSDRDVLEPERMSVMAFQVDTQTYRRLYSTELFNLSFDPSPDSGAVILVAFDYTSKVEKSTAAHLLSLDGRITHEFPEIPVDTWLDAIWSPDGSLFVSKNSGFQIFNYPDTVNVFDAEGNMIRRFAFDPDTISGASLDWTSCDTVR